MVMDVLPSDEELESTYVFVSHDRGGCRVGSLVDATRKAKDGGLDRDGFFVVVRGLVVSLLNTAGSTQKIPRACLPSLCHVTCSAQDSFRGFGQTPGQ